MKRIDPDRVGVSLGVRAYAGTPFARWLLGRNGPERIEGVRCYPDIAALPRVPDLAVVATPPDTVPELFPGLRVTLVHALVGNRARHDVNPFDLRVKGEGPRLVDDVGDLSSRVGVTAELDVAGPHQSVDREREHVELTASRRAYRTGAGVR